MGKAAYTFDEVAFQYITMIWLIFDHINEGMVWQFWPEKGAVRVNPGAAVP